MAQPYFPRGFLLTIQKKKKKKNAQLDAVPGSAHLSALCGKLKTLQFLSARGDH